MTVLAVLTVLAVFWRTPCAPLAGPTNTGRRGSRDGFDAFGGCGG